VWKNNAPDELTFSNPAPAAFPPGKPAQMRMAGAWSSRTQSLI
jgi:hypothetical protein